MNKSTLRIEFIDENYNRIIVEKNKDDINLDHMVDIFAEFVNITHGQYFSSEEIKKAFSVHA